MSTDGPPRNSVLGARASRPVPRRALKPRLSRDHVLWAYRLFLDREPESEHIVTSMLAELETTEQLRQRFVSSEEFRLKNPSLSPGTVNDNLVRWAYRLFLDREPESEDRVADKRNSSKSTEDLRRDFMASPEFRDRNPELTGLLPEKAVVVLKELAPGLRIFVDLADQAIGLNIARETFEKSELAFVRESVRLGDSVLDVGANVGFFAIHMASLTGAEGHVTAYEPIEANAALLERSIRENRFGGRITLRRAAVGAAPGRIRLAYIPLESGSRNSGGAYLLGADGTIPHHHEAVPVPMVRLDEEPVRRPVRFVKIDIEGAEPLALRGARELLGTDRPLILSEINPRQLARVAGCSPEELIGEMRGLGYECALLENGRAGKVIRQFEGDAVRSVVFRLTAARV
jgi:FkbM family methyltransferase